MILVSNPSELQKSGKFWTFNPRGEKILRDLEAEFTEKEFCFEYYCRGLNNIDDINYIYYENFKFFGIYESIGSDYERYGSIIEEGDVVLDIGANIGAFSRRAIQRGASKVYAFEPMARAFSCLIDNVDERTSCFKVAISDKAGFAILNTDPDAGSGGSSMIDHTENKGIEETVMTLSLEDLFSMGILPEKIDFCKIDCEGAEKMIFESWKDETILRFRKFSIEYHEGILGPELRNQTMERMSGLGFFNFTLFHAKGDLATIHFWK